MPHLAQTAPPAPPGPPSHIPAAPYSIHPGAATLTAQRVLNGARLTLRPVQPQDAPRLAALIARLSPTSRRHRFFCAVKLSAERVKQMACVDHVRQVALVITSGQGADEMMIAEARYCIDGSGRAAEFAIMVDDAWACCGIGSWLLRALRRAAADAGVHHLHGDVLAGNAAMLALVQRCGFDCTPNDEDERLSRVSADLQAGDVDREAVPLPGGLPIGQQTGRREGQRHGLRDGLQRWWRHVLQPWLQPAPGAGRTPGTA